MFEHYENTFFSFKLLEVAWQVRHKIADSELSLIREIGHVTRKILNAYGQKDRKLDGIVHEKKVITIWPFCPFSLARVQ